MVLRKGLRCLRTQEFRSCSRILNASASSISSVSARFGSETSISPAYPVSPMILMLKPCIGIARCNCCNIYLPPDLTLSSPEQLLNIKRPSSIAACVNIMIPVFPRTYPPVSESSPTPNSPPSSDYLRVSPSKPLLLDHWNCYPAHFIVRYVAQNIPSHDESQPKVTWLMQMPHIHLHTPDNLCGVR